MSVNLHQTLYNTADALNIHTRAIEVIGQNIANVNNEAYAARRVRISASPTMAIAHGRKGGTAGVLDLSVITEAFNIRIIQNNKVLASNKNWMLQVENRVTCLCARHNLIPQIAVDFREFKTEERNLLNTSKRPFPIDIEGAFRLKHRMAVGDILFEDSVEKQALVHKGSSVDVFIKKGYLTLSLKGIALDSGDLDEIILVRNTSSNKTFRGRIIDANTVQVAF